MEGLLVRDCCIVIIMAQSIPSVPIPPKAFIKCWHLLWLWTPEHERTKLLKLSSATLGRSWASRILHLALPPSNKRRMGKSQSLDCSLSLAAAWVASVIHDLWANWGEWGISRPRPKTRLSIPNNAFWARHGLSPRTAKSHNQSKTRKTKLKKFKQKRCFISFISQLHRSCDRNQPRALKVSKASKL